MCRPSREISSTGASSAGTSAACAPCTRPSLTDTVKVVPSPFSLSTPISPSIISTMLRVIAMPRPLPPERSERNSAASYSTKARARTSWKTPLKTPTAEAAAEITSALSAAI